MPIVATIVLPADVKAGTPASEYYRITTDYVIEIDITPNRVDGASHLGVARDLAAYLKQSRVTNFVPVGKLRRMTLLPFILSLSNA